jgi:phage recombination protein Bet
MTKDQIDLIKRTIAKGSTDDELDLFIQVCNRAKLDPFVRHIYAIKRWDSSAQQEVMAVQVSIDGARIIAERSGKYQGQLGPLWTKDGKTWVDVWLEATPPRAAKVAVLRSDFKEPLWAVATWDAYVAVKKDGRPTITWQKMGPLMLAKCAEMLAFRKGFPNDLSGLYSAEEMEQARNPVAPLPIDRAPSPEQSERKIEVVPDTEYREVPEDNDLCPHMSNPDECTICKVNTVAALPTAPAAEDESQEQGGTSKEIESSAASHSGAASTPEPPPAKAAGGPKSVFRSEGEPPLPRQNETLTIEELEQLYDFGLAAAKVSAVLKDMYKKEMSLDEVPRRHFKTVKARLEAEAASRQRAM